MTDKDLKALAYLKKLAAYILQVKFSSKKKKIF